MLKDLQLLDGDFVDDGDGSFIVLEGADAVTQQINHLMKLFLAEFFLEPGEGIDWHRLQEKGTTLQEVQEAIIDALRKEPAIESIEYFTMEKGEEARSLIVAWSVMIGGERVKGTETF